MGQNQFIHDIRVQSNIRVSEYIQVYIFIIRQKCFSGK